MQQNFAISRKKRKPWESIVYWLQKCAKKSTKHATQNLLSLSLNYFTQEILIASYYQYPWTSFMKKILSKLNIFLCYTFLNLTRKPKIFVLLSHLLEIMIQNRSQIWSLLWLSSHGKWHKWCQRQNNLLRQNWHISLISEHHLILIGNILYGIEVNLLNHSNANRPFRKQISLAIGLPQLVFSLGAKHWQNSSQATSKKHPKCMFFSALPTHTNKCGSSLSTF